jgi:hypothetical protein
LVGGAVWVRRLRGRMGLTPLAEPKAQPETNGRALLVALAGVGLGIACLRLYLDTRDSIFRHTRYDGQHVAGAALDLDLNFGDEMNLIGVDRPATMAADQPVPIVLYWRPYSQPAGNYSTSVRLIDGAGHLFGQQDVYQPGGLPTSVLVPENYVVDEHPLQAYAGTPPGEYRLLVSVYPEAGTGPALTVYDANHAPSGNTLEVARVTLTAPRRAPTDAELKPQHITAAPLGPLALVGFDLPATRAAPGDDLPLILYWRVLSPAPDTLARLRLVDASGRAESLGDFSPVTGGLPASAWQTGAAWRAPQQVLVPPTASAGLAAFRLSLVNAAGEPLGDEVTLGTLELTSPARQFAVPKMSVSGDWRVGDAIRLLGYDLPMTKLSPGSALPLTLYWQAEAVTMHRYVVFVHVLDSSGQIVAQTDTPPLQGARPTTGWLPGEVLTDPYTLTLPAELRAGEYTVESGLYDVLTLERLPVMAPGQPANDRVILGTIRVEP